MPIMKIKKHDIVYYLDKGRLKIRLLTVFTVLKDNFYDPTAWRSVQLGETEKVNYIGPTFILNI